MKLITFDDNGISNIEKTFERFTIFCKTRWRAVILTFVFVCFMILMFLFTFFAYVKIENISKIVSPTSNELQEGLIKSVSENEYIKNEFERLMKDTGADRVRLFKFHNSQSDFFGKHFFYISNVNEVVAEGISKEIERLQSIPLDNYNKWVEKFLKNECINQNTTEENKNTIKNYLELQGVKQVVACPVFNFEEDTLIGFISLNYVKDYSKEVDINNIKISSLKISGILN